MTETHAKRRARERLRVDLTREHFCEMIRAIRAGKAERLCDARRNLRIVRIDCPAINRKVCCVVDEKDYIVTILPDENVHVRYARRRKAPRELDIDWTPPADDEAFDADALADVLVNVLRSHVRNDVLEVKLKEAGIAT